MSKIDNDPVALSMAVAEAGPDPEVVVEACYGWYWAADLLAAEGARVRLVHPLGLHWDSRRVKNDVKDATELAHRLRRNDVPEAWIAPPPVRELRELVRYRAKLTALRTSAKAQIHAFGEQAGELRDGTGETIERDDVHVEKGLCRMLGDLIASFLGQVLPGDLGEAARMRRYKKGGRVVFPGRVEGVGGVPFKKYLVAQQGQLWVTNVQKDEQSLVPVPPPKPEASIEVHEGTLKDSFHLSYESDQGGVSIYPWMNRFLLERVLEEARRTRGAADA